MKTSKRYTVKPEKIKSLQDIELEIQRLHIEIMKKEENIHSDYRHILEAFSIRNIATTMINDLSATSSLVSKAFGFGKSIIARRKKKKHDKIKAAADDPGS